MEKIGSAPAIAHLSFAVELRTSRDFEFDLLEVISEKSTGDLGVGSDRIFTKDRMEVSDR